jgi:enterochelin esterase family protein
MRRFLLMTMLAALCGSALAAAGLPRFSGTLAAQAHREHPVQLETGDFVQGRLTGRAMRLVLLDRDGKRAQILAKGRRDDQDFMFIAGDAGPYTLDVRAPVAGAYELQLTRRVPRAAQVAPATLPDSPRLRSLREALAGGAGTASFWKEAAAGGGPLVETAGVTPALDKDEALVTFLWRGATSNVRILGAPSSDHDAMTRLGDSDVWYRSYRVPASTRLSYRLAPDVPDFDGSAMERRRAILATAQRDPLNPRSFPAKPLDRFDGASVLELPAAPPQSWIEPRAGIAAGTVETLRLASGDLGNERDSVLYRSAGWRPGAAGNALVVLFDAENFTSEVPTPVILDNLVGSGVLPPTAAILIANPSAATRGAELPPNPAFARFLAAELLPWARSRGVYADAARTVITGASYGGLAAAYAGLRHPELFGNVYSQSGSFWWAPEGAESGWLTREFAAGPTVPVRFLLEAGLYETGRAGSPGILDTTRHLRDVLRAKGYDVTHREFAAGHDYYHWRGSLGDGLATLLGKRSMAATNNR